MAHDWSALDERLIELNSAGVAERVIAHDLKVSRSAVHKRRKRLNLKSLRPTRQRIDIPVWLPDCLAPVYRRVTMFAGEEAAASLCRGFKRDLEAALR